MGGKKVFFEKDKKKDLKIFFVTNEKIVFLYGFLFNWKNFMSVDSFTVK